MSVDVDGFVFKDTEDLCFTRSPIHCGASRGLAVAVHPRFVAFVCGDRPDEIAVFEIDFCSPPARLEAKCKPNGAAASLGAPRGPVEALRFTDGCADVVRLLGATTRDIYLWSDVTRVGCEPVCLRSIEIAPTLLPAFGFDESGALVAVGSNAMTAQLSLDVFQCDGNLFAEVPGVVGEAITACTFLRGEMPFVLVATVHIADDVGQAIACDLRRSADGACTYSYISPELKGAPLSVMCAHRTQGSVFCVGGVGGLVRIMQLQEREGFKGFIGTQLAEVELSVSSASPVWLQDGHSRSDESAACCEVGQDILALEILDCAVTHAPAELGLSGTIVLAVTTSAVHVVWAHLRRVEKLCGVPPLGAVAACHGQADGELLAVYVHAFDLGAAVMRLKLDPQRIEQKAEVNQRQARLLESPADTPEDPPICSVMPLGPIPKDSILGRALAPPQTPTGGQRSGYGGEAGRVRATSVPTGGARKHGVSSRTSSGGLKDQPVTFHRKVKSAGYGPPSEPPRQLGKPRLAARASRPSQPDFGRPTSASRRPSTADGCAAAGSYLAADAIGPPLQLRSDLALAAYPGAAVVNLCYTPQVSHLVVAGSDFTMSAYRLPLGAAGKNALRPLGLGGHTSDITSLCPSYTDSHSTGGGGSPLLLSASADGTARLWALGGSHAGEDLIVFDRSRSSRHGSETPPNAVTEHINDAKFMCLDGAIVLAMGSRLSVYKYQLHVQDANDDIKRLRKLGSYKCCGALSLPKSGEAGQNITLLASSNGLVSGTLVVATSSKRLCVWDVAAERELAAIPESMTHRRQITCLRLAQPHADFQSAQSLDLFYSAGMDGVVKLWDMRSMKACRCFEGGHQHSSHRLQFTMSPCLRFLCAPSEDGRVCGYDVRSGSVLGTTWAHREPVCVVDIHPRVGAVASGGFDGNVNFFTAPKAEQRRPPRGGKPGGGIRERDVGSAQRVSEPRVREVEMSSGY